MSHHARIEIRPAAGYPNIRPSERPQYLRLVAANGRVLATSEMYTTPGNAQRAAVAWKRAFGDVLDPIGGDGEYVRKVWYFDAEGRRLR